MHGDEELWDPRFLEIRRKLADGVFDLSGAFVECRKIGMSFGPFDAEIDSWGGIPPGSGVLGPMAELCRDLA
jgi:hypothetical protein